MNLARITQADRAMNRLEARARPEHPKSSFACA